MFGDLLYLSWWVIINLSRQTHQLIWYYFSLIIAKRNSDFTEYH